MKMYITLIMLVFIINTNIFSQVAKTTIQNNTKLIVKRIIVTDSEFLNINDIIDENGVVKNIFDIKNKVPDANYELYSIANNIILVKGAIINGEKNGIWKYYNEFGLIDYEIDYKKGEKNGTEKRYDLKGRIIEEIPYKDDIVDGRRIMYYSNGNIKSILNYSKGTIVGKVETFDKN